MTALVDRYIELYQEQLFERVGAGGALAQDREGEYVDLFEEIWDEMRDEEHRAVEAFLALELTPSSEAFVDVEDHGNVPRQRAA